MTKTIGVLALQGAVQPHKPHIEACGAHFKAVKTAADFDTVDALILPGGESTTMLKLIERFDLWDTLKHQFETKPVWGICAGSILLAETVTLSKRPHTTPAQQSFAMLPITVERNGYGRQLDSHLIRIQDYTVSLIRAPIITAAYDSVTTLASYDGTPVWVEKNNIMASTFHPEMTLDFPSPMHHYFISRV